MTALLAAVILAPLAGVLTVLARPARDYLAACRRPESEDPAVTHHPRG